MRHIVIFLLLGASALANAADGFTFSNTAGPYAVGLRVKQQYDYSRVFKTRINLVSGQPSTGERARPVQALLWYPADSGGTSMRYRDYLRTAFTEIDFDMPASEVARRDDAMATGLLRGPRTDYARRALAAPMSAVRDAAQRQGRFPVVVYAPSFSASAFENADLCEYLASQGYIVVASASLGPRTRAMTDNLEGIEAQAADIAFLIAYARTLPQADMERIAVVGFSWGGLSNVMAAAKDDRIGALVSLDGSMRGFTEYVNGGKDAAKYVTPARLALPLLYLARRASPVEEINKRQIDTTFSLMNQMKYSDVYIGTMHPMTHLDFSSHALRFSDDGEFQEYSREEAALAHSWAARYVHRFLDAYLKRDAAALAFMNNSPAKNQVPAHMLSMDMRRASATPANMETLVGTLARRGFEHAVEVYETLHKQDAAFSLADHSLNSWGYELLRGAKERDAVEIFKLGTHLYPDNGNLFDSLGEAHEQVGNKELATAAYRRALALNPKNNNAALRLKALGGGA